jgi:SAM-dependent methyltransferase
MVELARSKAARAGLAVPFVVADLASLPEAFGEQKWDAVLCLGNSLPHLLTDDDLIGALRGMATVMSPGGLLLVQNLNYDLRWRTQPRFFSPQGGSLEGQEVLVWRFADYDVPAERIAFHVALFRKAQEAGWAVEVHTTGQRPLLWAVIERSLAIAGFEAARAYGQMTLPAPPFEPATSGDLVIVARRAPRL